MKKDFLQSTEWRKFQESVGHKTFFLESENFHASIIEHSLPIVGKYFYIPRGPIINNQKSKNNEQYLKELINLAKKEKAGWIRIEPNDSQIIVLIGNNSKVVKAPHDMQPKEVFILDITKTEEELLAKMKSKTRYNIKLATRNSKLKVYTSNDKKYIEEFLRLNSIMAARQKIKTHAENYYRKMFETIPNEIVKLYIAEYDNEVIASHIMIFYGGTCTYLHGASDDKYKNLMAPYLLQWQAIQDAKKMNCEKYDFGGIKTNSSDKKSWEGITRFKLGFSPSTPPVEFLGSYDIIINPVKYWAYRTIQFIRKIL